MVHTTTYHYTIALLLAVVFVASLVAVDAYTNLVHALAQRSGIQQYPSNQIAPEGTPACGPPVYGGGTTNFLAKWTGPGCIRNSVIYDNGQRVGIGTTAPTDPLTVNGAASAFVFRDTESPTYYLDIGGVPTSGAIAGDLAIGTPGGTTGYRLLVAGDQKVDGILDVTGAATASVFRDYAAPTSYFLALGSADSGAIAGNLAIGTPGGTGGYRLLVAGDQMVDGNLRISNLTGSSNAFICVDALGQLFRSSSPCA